MRIEILLAADIAAELLVAVDEHDERVLRLERARIQAGVEVAAIVSRYSPSAGKVCVNFVPPRVPSGIPGTYAFWSAARRREISGSDFRYRLADREVRDGARGGQVLLDERRRHAERGRDVREAVDLDVRRQIFLGIDVDVEQRLHGCAYSARYRR